jgi:hypothetical protein
MSQTHGTKRSWPHTTLGLAAASLGKDVAIGPGHVRELVRFAVVLAFAAPGHAAAASVPARGPSLDGCVLGFRGGGHHASQCGGEEAEADLHFVWEKRSRYGLESCCMLRVLSELLISSWQNL